MLKHVVSLVAIVAVLVVVAIALMLASKTSVDHDDKHANALASVWRSDEVQRMLGRGTSMGSSLDADSYFAPSGKDCSKSTRARQYRAVHGQCWWRGLNVLCQPASATCTVLVAGPECPARVA